MSLMIQTNGLTITLEKFRFNKNTKNNCRVAIKIERNITGEKEKTGIGVEHESQILKRIHATGELHLIIFDNVLLLIHTIGI